MNIQLFILFLTLLFSAGTTSGDSLDEIRNYKSDDRYFKAGMVSLHFIIETSAPAHIDTVFNQTIQRYNLPLNAQGCQDGVYTGESPYDAHDYKHRVTLEIKDEKIRSVDYDEIHASGKSKQEDEAYCREMSVTGTTPAQAFPNMEKQLVEKQDVSRVDAVTGATYSLYRFRYAVMVALMKAHLGKH